jgi:uncharacterized protein (TIGR03437 family)
MKYLIRFFVLILIFSFASHTTESYIRTPTSAGVPIFWNLSNPSNPSEVSGGRIIYSLNPAGSDDLDFSQVEQAIAASFQTWEDIPTSAVAFTRGPDSTSTTTSNDNVLQLFWLENSTTTSDGLNVAGVLAVTQLTFITSGAGNGEIIDAAIVYNGNQIQWAVDGSDTAADVAEVTTHELGHLIGINHSPIGGATMFPRTAIGRIKGRTLDSDDQIAASVIYPSSGFASSTGVIRGRVVDNNGAVIFGAHVAAVNANGVVVAGAISQPDGGYSIQGLPPDNYTVYAEPLDPVSNGYFSRSNLPQFYSNINVDFQTSADLSVAASPGGTTTADISVVRGNPPFDGYYVFDEPLNGFLNVGTAAAQGQINVTIGVAGPGLPQSGSPLSVTGPGISILRTYFGTSNDGSPAVLADIDVSADAPPGSRNIVISNGSQRTIVTGGLEILSTSGLATVSSVNAAGFTSNVAAESIVTAFGGNLATTTAFATLSPLPTTLGGTQVKLLDSSGNEQLAPLFFVSPSQINYQITPGILTGDIAVLVISGSGALSIGSMPVESVAPGVFAANANGQGVAAAVALRIRNGVQTYEPVFRFDSGQNQSVPIPIDLGPAGDQVYLVLFCTGVRFRSSLSGVSFDVGGIVGAPTYAGAQGELVGVDQVNVPLSRDLIGRGVVNVILTVDGKPSNTVTADIL